MKTRTFRAPSGAEWVVEVRVPGASNAMVAFLDVAGSTSDGDRYAWYLTTGPEARDVTARMDGERLLQSLDEPTLARLFRRSIPIGRPMPTPGANLDSAGGSYSVRR